jgi:hypothetical protein
MPSGRGDEVSQRVKDEPYNSRHVQKQELLNSTTENLLK